MRIGIDLGGTKTEGIVLNPAGCELLRRRYRTPQAEGYSAVLSTIVSLARELEQSVDENCSVGIGTPGVISPADGSLRNSNTACLIGKPIVADLARELGRPVRVENDANCFALAEARLGAGQGAPTVFGIILGTGVGGGVVIDGRVLPGGQGIGGEWGHIVLDPDGSECYCGQRGCVETFLSGPFLETFYARRSGSSLPLGDISKRAIVGQDVAAVETINRLVTWFGRGVATVINILDPHVVVLGGGVSNVDALYTRGIEALAPWVFNDTVQTRIVRNELGDSAGVFGAAMLVA